MNIIQEWWLRRLKLNIPLLNLVVKCKLTRFAGPLARHWVQQSDYEMAYNQKMRTRARIFLGYEGALDGFGYSRDSVEFAQAVTSRMAETAELLYGKIPPRVKFHIVMNNPKEFPLDHLKARLALAGFAAYTFIWKNMAILGMLTVSVILNLYMGLK